MATAFFCPTRTTSRLVTGCSNRSPTVANAVEDRVQEALAICRRRRHRSLENYIDRQRISGMLRLIASPPRCHPASRMAKSKIRPHRKKLRRKIPTDNVQTAEQAFMAITLPSHSSEPKTVLRQVKHRSAKAKPPRSGGRRNVTRSRLCGGGRIQTCRRSERWRVFERFE
jgi:hypothetical protein